MTNRDFPTSIVIACIALFTALRFPDPYSQVYLGQQKLEDAEKDAREVVRLDQTEPYVFLNLGDILLARGKKEYARAQWKHAVELDPLDADAIKAKNQLEAHP